MLGTDQQLTVNQPAKLTLCTADLLGNACTHSGDQVQLALKGPAGSEVTMADVQSLGNGYYGITFLSDLAGSWTLFPRQGSL